VREVTPQEGNQILLQADVYLGSFPHGGATSAMLALVHGVPVAARETPWFRGTSDPSLLRSMGLKELIGADNQGFIDVAVRLGLDSAWRHDVKARIAARIGRAPFLSSSCSKKLKRLFDEIVLDHRLLPNKSIMRAG
jgi:predicted O-linked N-acetylglucosamine transferase (SPINDLY family)